MPNETPLNRPVWNALSGAQKCFALGNDVTRRFAPQYGPLTAAIDYSAESVAALRAMEIGGDGGGAHAT